MRPATGSDYAQWMIAAPANSIRNLRLGLDRQPGQRHRRELPNQGRRHGGGQRHAAIRSQTPAGRAVRRPGVGEPGNVYLQHRRDHRDLDRGPRPMGAVVADGIIVNAARSRFHIGGIPARRHAGLAGRDHAGRRGVRCRGGRHRAGRRLRSAWPATSPTTASIPQTIDASLVLTAAIRPLTRPPASS